MTIKKGDNYLVNINDTQFDYGFGDSYTIQYLKNVLKNSIINCEKEFICTVRSFVADNIFIVKACTLNLNMIQILI